MALHCSQDDVQNGTIDIWHKPIWASLDVNPIRPQSKIEVVSLDVSSNRIEVLSSGLRPSCVQCERFLGQP